MTRPRVAPEKRQRTACACDNCKRRKQKCDGQETCSACRNRGLSCNYSSSRYAADANAAPVQPPAKRRKASPSSRPLQSAPEYSQGHFHQAQVQFQSPWDNNFRPGRPQYIAPRKQSGPEPAPAHQRRNRPESDARLKPGVKRRRGSTSRVVEEADMATPQRMVHDGRYRRAFVGDSSTLSPLQFVRQIVVEFVGQTAFTEGPKTQEAPVEPMPAARPIRVLPDQKTARILIAAYFTNTAGLADVIDEVDFRQQMDQYYENPLSVESSWLCLLYLVLAIGLVMANPAPRSEEDVVIQAIRRDKANHAEQFYRNAKDLADTVTGFEDGDFWSIQAHVLMSLYLLAVSRMNAAWMFLGMAVRSANALGLHKDEDEVDDDDDEFSSAEVEARRRLWRTVFVLDRFFAASLGRPISIAEEDCSATALNPPPRSPDREERLTASDHHVMLSFNAAVESSQILGSVLKKVYSKRKMSTAVAQDLAEELQGWSGKLDDRLHWRQLVASGRSEPIVGVANLHANLLHCHSVILLTRPFFLYVLNEAFQQTKRGAGSHRGKPISQKWERYAQTCVEASQLTLFLARSALRGGYLPRRSPFVICFVFAAGLTVLSNEFASLYRDPEAGQTIDSCIQVLEYCSGHDEHASRDEQASYALFVIESFHQTIKTPSSTGPMRIPGRETPVIHPLSAFRSGYDPAAHFFRRDPEQAGGHLPPPAPTMTPAPPPLRSSELLGSTMPSGTFLRQSSRPEDNGASPLLAAPAPLIGDAGDVPSSVGMSQAGPDQLLNFALGDQLEYDFVSSMGMIHPESSGMYNWGSVYPQDHSGQSHGQYHGPDYSGPSQ